MSEGAATAMDARGRTYSYAEGLMEFYAGEVAGEAIYSALLDVALDPQEQLKLSCLMQLETETKAWLRPHMLAAGLSVAEPASMREPGAAFVALLAPLGWREKMQAIDDLVPQYVGLYQRYADAAQARGRVEEASVCDFMVEHEKAQAEFTRRELADEPLQRSLEPITRHSRYPLRG